jgi:squalene synthase HpnC
MASLASTPIPELLRHWGPDTSASVSLDQARHYCRSLTLGHGENFSVLTRLVPDRMRDGMCAVYAFCRWADDLGDEIGDPDRSLELLSWWRRELHDCYAGNATHPVFIALAPVIQRHDLDIEPFEALIGAFEQDQTVTRYERWDDVIAYCAGSADPVGRLVLALSDEPCTEEQLTMSDSICTALQLANHWQDVKRDLLDRDRIYLPSELHRIPDFEDRLRSTAINGHAPDRDFLPAYRSLVKTCVERTWTLFENGEALSRSVSRDVRPVIWLFPAGGTAVLRRIEQWNHETCLGRPRVGLLTKMRLAFEARRIAARRSDGST